MLGLLDKLRERPEHERQTFAFIFAFAVTSALALLWLTTFIINAPERLSGIFGSSGSQEETALEAPGPLVSAEALVNDALKPLFELFK